MYPNTYAVGMSNLGFQAIYGQLNALPDVVCERVFLPDPEDVDELARTGTAPFSLESLRPLSDFHLIGFSVTYEGDYINVVRLLRLAGIPARPATRGPEHPLVLMGGVCAFSNPEPLAPFMDFVAVGEGEELVGEIVAAYREHYAAGDAEARERFLGALRGAPRASTCPGAYDVSYAADGTIAAVAPVAPGAPAVVTKRRLRDVNAFETASTIKSPKAEYGHMELLEVGKGCGRGCRFCLEGQVYRPVRHRSLERPARVGGPHRREHHRPGPPRRAGRRVRLGLSVDRRPHEAASRSTASRCRSPRCAPTASPRTSSPRWRAAATAR